MRQEIVILFFLTSIALHGHAQTIKPMLKDGVITYLAKNGERTNVQIDRPCADLWVAPDEKLIAFITLDKTDKSRTINDVGYLEESSIHIAMKSDNFKPLTIAMKPISIRGMRWKVVREPSLSPDLKTLYFTVPSAMTSWSLFSTQMPTGENNLITVGKGSGYCVIWGGSHSGDLLINIRTIGEAMPSASYPCFLRNKNGKLKRVARDNECAEFWNYAPKWSQKNGGVCRPPEFTQIW
jgi:hypothetical protein